MKKLITAIVFYGLISIVNPYSAFSLNNETGFPDKEKKEKKKARNYEDKKRKACDKEKKKTKKKYKKKRMKNVKKNTSRFGPSPYKNKKNYNI